MNLTENRVVLTHRVLTSMNLLHTHGTAWPATDTIAKVAAEPHHEVRTILEQSLSVGWVLMDPNSFCWRVSEAHVAVIYQPKNCDVCWFTNHVQEKAIADARTSGGQWGNICARHFVELNCTLGMGRGQFLRAEY